MIGLGNPGAKYTDTRHNIGYRVVDKLVDKYKLEWGSVDSLHLKTTFRCMGTKVHLVKPLTFMNLSGDSARFLLDSLRFEPNQLVVVSDEYNFPVGRIHLRQGGSSGGHNGLASIIEELGDESFWRLRCGIGREFGLGELVEYVLSPFTEAEEGEVERMIQLAVRAIEEIARLGASVAMTQVNRA